MNSSIYAGLRWLLVSPIQLASGGVCLDYRAPEAELGSVTTESTAWYIQGLLGIGEHDDHRVQRAAKAGRFLMETAFDLSTDLFINAPAEEPGRRSQAEFLSCTAAIRALVALYRATGDSAYRECAARCARSMRVRLARVDGSFFPVYDVTGQAPVCDIEPDVEQLKAAAIWTVLADAASEREHMAPIEQLTAWAMRRYQITLTEGDEPAAAQRRYALFLEGLLPAASIDFIAAQTLQSGLNRLEVAFDDTPALSRSPSVLARLLRLRLLADSLGIAELHYGRAREEAARLRAYQVQSTDPKVDGGFGMQPTDELEAVVDPESAIVALQALTMWEQAETGALRADWQQLI